MRAKEKNVIKTVCKSGMRTIVHIVIDSGASQNVVNEQSYLPKTQRLASITVELENRAGATSTLKEKIHVDTEMVRVVVTKVFYIPGMEMNIS